jgi:cytochrome c peroxidase
LWPEEIFNTFFLTITRVGGLNDALNQATIRGNCTTCHDTPNVGNHSLPVPLDIGVSHPRAFENDAINSAALTELTVPDLPIFKITCTSVQPATVFYTSDPGRALITGRCSDLNRVKGPILRGLAARAPYFHNGAAATLMEVVDFYNERFQMRLTDEQKEQLVAFLHSL